MTFEEFVRLQDRRRTKQFWEAYQPQSLDEWKAYPSMRREQIPPVKGAKKGTDGLWYFVETDSPPVHTPTKIS